MTGQAVFRVYVASVVAVAGAVVAALIASGYRITSPFAVLLLAALAALAERGSIRLTPALEASISSVIFVFAGVVFGPLAAVVVGAAGLLVVCQAPYARWLVWTAVRTIVAAGAALAAAAVLNMGSSSFAAVLLAVAAASLVDAVGDLTFHSITPALRGTASLWEVMKELLSLQIASIPLHVPLIAILAYAYREISPWSVAFFALPAFAAQRLFVLYRQERETAEKLSAANTRLERANLSFATALVATLDARDRCTAGHSAAVAVYARDIADRLGLPEDEQRLAHVCGLVHDIGKIGLPPGLLEKPGPLTLEERRQMEKHSEIGERILAKVDDYTEIAAIVRHHHERIDGEGYPDHLIDGDIPFISRIIAVADAYNAMTSDRPYRDAMPSQVARLRLAQAVGSQFDTGVVAAFEAILASASVTYCEGSAFSFAAESRNTGRVDLRLGPAAIVSAA